MPNWEKPGDDFPSREDVMRQERDERRRWRQEEARNRKISDYLLRHPSASWAEAAFKVDEEQS